MIRSGKYSLLRTCGGAHTARGARCAIGRARAFRAALLALCLLLLCAAGAPVFAARGDLDYDTSHTFNIYNGHITVVNGSTAETLGVWYGPAPQSFQDLILPDETIEIIGTSTAHSISVETTRRVRIALKEVSINRSLAGDNACAFSLIPSANVILGLKGENTLKSGPSYAGIRVPRGASLEIVGDGVLNRDGVKGDIVLVLDESPSMMPPYSNRLPKMKDAAIKFSENILSKIPSARIAVVEFAGTANTVIGFSSNINDLTVAINTIDGISPSGGTNPYAGLYEARNLLASLSGGSVILLSDGEPTVPADGGSAAVAIAIEMMEQYAMYSIGIQLADESAGAQFLRKIQDKGCYDIQDLSDFQEVFDEIGESITTAYDTLTAISEIPAANALIGGAGIGGNDGESAGNITIRGASVTAYSGGQGAGIGGGRGGDGGRFLLDGGDVRAYSAPAHSGYENFAAYGAGVGGGRNGFGGSIAIANGKLLAYSASSGDGYGAGLGSGAYGAGGGEIAIAHTALAEAYSAFGTGKGYGAGLGGGRQSPGGTIVAIANQNNIVVKSSKGGTDYGAGLGAGYENSSQGNVLILTNSQSGDYLVGHVVLPAAIERYVISALDRLIIPAGASLRIPAGVTLVNDGIIENYGSLINDAKLVNNGRIDNFADMRGGGQFIQNPGSFYSDGAPVRISDAVPYFEREQYWYTPGGGSWRGLRAADDKVWVDYSISGTSATLYLTPQKAEEIARNAEDGTADFDLSGSGGLTEWSFPKAALAYFAEKGLSIEFKTPAGALRISRAAAADIAAQGGGEQLYLRFRKIDAQTLNDAQRRALQADDAVYELTAAVSGQQLRAFDGSVTALVPYQGALPAGAWRLTESGRREPVAFVFENSTLRFSAGAFSLFAVGRGGSPATDVNIPWYYVK
jgi:uncharacterized protein YegL